ncbi:MAG: oxidoreductase [Desulfurococcales archaeon ex4484_58]|nr:MAG: oxidoreductase [Desulfurococcales archaeon ex4484_58]
MRYRVLGHSDLKISVLGLGFWQIGSRLWNFRNGNVEESSVKIVEKAYSYGVNFYDTAEIYGGGLSEKYLGLAIKKLGIRDEVIVASKVAGYKHTFNSIIKSIERSNKRLGFTMDLIQHHWVPPIYGSICRVINTLEKTVEDRLASYYGLSNYGERELKKALECVKKIEPVSNQVQYNLGYRVVENQLKPYMEKKGLTLIAWSPLAKGSLAGLKKPLSKAQRKDPVFKAVIQDSELLNVLEDIARKHNVPVSAISLAWLIEMNTIPIPGTRSPRRVDEYVQAVKIKLDQKDLSLLDKVSRKYVVKWGKRYNSLGGLRYIPGFLQHLYITLFGGI